MVVDHLLTLLSGADDDLREVGGGVSELFAGLLEEGLAGQGGQRSFFAGLPDNAVTADDREGGIPRPDCDWEVEGGDDADWAEREPVFLHRVVLSFAGDGEAVELARDSDGEIADVDHLLDFAAAFFEDLAAFEADEGGEVFFVLAKFVSELPDELASFGTWDIAPGAECLYALGNFRFNGLSGIERE